MPGILEEPSIPVIDLTNFAHRKREVSQQLLQAAKDVGFFYVCGHGIPDAEVDRVFNEVRSVWPACVLQNSAPESCQQLLASARSRTPYQLQLSSQLAPCRVYGSLHCQRTPSKSISGCQTGTWGGEDTTRSPLSQASLYVCASLQHGHTTMPDTVLLSRQQALGMGKLRTVWCGRL